MNDRKYLPTLSELIDRLSIAQLKEVFIKDHKKEYAQEIKDIVNDIQLTLDEKKHMKLSIKKIEDVDHIIPNLEKDV